MEDDRPSLPDEAALGVTYDNIDDYTEGKTLDSAIAKTIEGWYVKTEHKRRLPITVFDDFGKSKRTSTVVPDIARLSGLLSSQPLFNHPSAVILDE